MNIKILNQNIFIVNVYDQLFKCIICDDGYAAISEYNLDGCDETWLYDIEDINTLGQAIDVLYQEFTDGVLYYKIDSCYNNY